MPRKSIGQALAAKPKPKAVEETRTIGANDATRPDRHGKVNITGYFDPAVKASFRAIQVQRPELTMHDLMSEAFDLLFEKHRVPQTARVRRRTTE